MPTGTIIAKGIRHRITTGKENQLYVVSDFADMGNSDAVTRILSRLSEENVLVRLAQGLYLFPIRTRFGMQKPSLDTIAETIAAKDKSVIIPSGLTALNLLGLSTQVPMNAVYVTNGTARKLNIDNRTIIFKKAAPSAFVYQSKLFAMVVLAMKEIGANNITEAEINSIRKTLSSAEDLDTIRKDILHAPQWIQKHLHNI